MKYGKWLISTIILVGVAAVILVRPFPFLFYPALSHYAFFGRALYILLLACLLCLYRVIRGPTSVDRLVAVDLMGIMIIGLCAVLTIATRHTWYLDVGIAWALQSFITVLSLSKYIEGKDLDA